MMRFFSPDLAIDLGSSTTRIYLRGEGVVVSEPSLIAVRQIGKHAGEIVAAGAEARALLGRVPQGIGVVSPVVGGVITDFDNMDSMLRIAGERRRVFTRMRRPRVVVAVPFDLTAVERRAVVESTLRAGGREVRLVPKVIAAAIGLDLPYRESTGQFILDFGQSTTEMCVVSASGVATSHTERTGSASLDAALKTYVRRKCNLLIGDATAELLKHRLGSASPVDDGARVEIRGRNLISGNPAAAELASEDVREALEDPVSTLIDQVCATLERTPPELAGDLYRRGIMLIGGGSLLEGLDRRLHEATGLAVVRPEDPRNVVIQGASRIVDDLAAHAGLFVE